MPSPRDKESVKESVFGILFGVIALLLTVGPSSLLTAEGFGEFTRAAGITGIAGSFLVEDCYPERGRNGAGCTGAFIAPGTQSIQTRMRGGPHPRNTIIPARYGNGSLTASGPGTAAAGLAMALLGLALIAVMATGCLRFIISCDAIYLPIGHALLIAAAISGIAGTLAVVTAVIIP